MFVSLWFWSKIFWICHWSLCCEYVLLPAMINMPMYGCISRPRQKQVVNLASWQKAWVPWCCWLQCQQKFVNSVKSDLGITQKWKEIQSLPAEPQCGLLTQWPRQKPLWYMERNRAGTLINPYAMHSKGLQIYQGWGWHVPLAGLCALNSTLIPWKRRPRVKKFKELCMNFWSHAQGDRSRTLCKPELKPWQPLSFIKAILQCTPTPEDELADSTGHLGGHLHNNSTDREFVTMIQKGMDMAGFTPLCRRSSSWNYQTWSKKPLNASNSIYATQSEMELACSIMNFVVEKGGKIDDWEQLSFDLCEGPHFKKNGMYKTIAKFVRLFSGPGSGLCIVWFFLQHFLKNILLSHVYLLLFGGYIFLSLKSLNSGYPLIHKEVPMPYNPEGGGSLINFHLSVFSKEYGQGVHLGEDLPSLHAPTTVISVNDMTPMIRVALLATNLTRDKIVDGVGRLLLKSDVEKLKSKKLQTHGYVKQRKLLLGRWKDLEKDTKLNQTQKFKDSLGRLAWGLAYSWLGSRREGGKGFCIFRWKSGWSVSKRWLNTSTAGHSMPASSCTPKASSIVQLHEAKNAMYVAGQKIELKVGNHYTHKDFEDRGLDLRWGWFKTIWGSFTKICWVGLFARTRSKTLRLQSHWRLPNKNHLLCWMPSMYLHCCVPLLQNKKMTSVPSSSLWLTSTKSL